jgi:hypothetical protein
MVFPPRVAYHAWAALLWPGRPYFSVPEKYYRDFDAVADAAAEPPVVPVLVHRRRIRAPGDVDDVVHDLLVIPAERKLGLVGFADPVSVSPAGRVTIQYVSNAFRAGADCV